jgi:hypothetical protein
MTAPPVATDDLRAVCDRLRRLQKLRERLAHDVWSLWTETPEGRRYEAATGAERRRLAGQGWRWVSDRVAAMAGQIADEAGGEAPLPR